MSGKKDSRPWKTLGFARFSPLFSDNRRTDHRGQRVSLSLQSGRSINVPLVFSGAVRTELDTLPVPEFNRANCVVLR